MPVTPAQKPGKFFQHILRTIQLRGPRRLGSGPQHMGVVAPRAQSVLIGSGAAVGPAVVSLAFVQSNPPLSGNPRHPLSPSLPLLLSNLLRPLHLIKFPGPLPLSLSLSKCISFLSRRPEPIGRHPNPSMTPSPPPTSTAPSTRAETLDLILHHLLPLLLAAALSVKSFVGRWRLLHSKLSLLHSSLSDAASSPHWPSNPLFLDLLPPLHATLRDLHALSARCLDASLPAGKLLLQSDLDIAASALSLHLHDLGLIIRSGLLHHCHHHPHAIVLPLPGPAASQADLSLFLRDLFARLQIGALDLKQKALDSLLSLLSSDPPKLSPLVAQEGDLAALLRLLDPSTHSLIRDQASVAVSLLCTASAASRRAVFDEGGLGPLLRLLETGSAAVRERAAAAIYAITAESSNSWAVSAYGGVPVLIEACRSVGGSAAVQALAAGSLKNISAVDDLRAAMVEDGAVPVLVDLLASGTCEAQKNVALCLWALASLSGEEIRVSIVSEGGLQQLLRLLREASDPEVIDHAMRAIHALSASAPAARSLSSSPGFLVQLADLIVRGSATAQETAASLLCSLSPSEESKRSMDGCMAPLVKMMEFSKPATTQEVAARALTSLLAVQSNRTALSRDGKSLARLVQMLDPRRDEVCKKFPVSVILALSTGGGAGGCRKRLAEAGACHQHLQKLAEANVPGAKKAVQRFAGGRLRNLFTMSWRD